MGRFLRLFAFSAIGQIPHSKPSAALPLASARSAMAPPPPPELVVDVVAEILLRLPPHKPECLFRAALVCKPWLRTIIDPAFLRRYRAFHGVPPLLSLLITDSIDGKSLVPTTAVPAFPLPGPDPWYCYGDCRHGRVLIHVVEDQWLYHLVFDPVTGDHRRLPQPGIGTCGMTNVLSAVMVFCAAAGCKHLDCHGGPFCVLLMGKHLPTRTASATVYSSERGTWSMPATLNGLDTADGRGALIGDEIYLMVSTDAVIAKYDLGKNCLSVIKLPQSAIKFNYCKAALMVMEDNSLGLAAIRDSSSSLFLWSRKGSSVGTAKWVKRRVIDLETVMPMANPSVGASVVGFAEGVCVIFVNTDVGLFMMELKSGRVRKVDKPGTNLSVLPYMSFYTPDRCRILSSLGGSTVLRCAISK